MHRGRGRGSLSPRGRGRGIRRDQGRSHPYQSSASTRSGPQRPEYHPFDLWQAEEIFPQAAPPPDDEGMSKALAARHAEIKIDSALQSQLMDHFTRVSTTLDNIIALQSSDDSPFVDKVRPVGAHRMSTAIRGNMTYQVVIMFKAWPTEDDLTSICNRVKEGLEKNYAESSSKFTTVTAKVDKSSFSLSCGQSTVQCLAAYQPESWLERAKSDQVPLKDIEDSLKEIERSRWCDEHITHTSTRMVIRLLNDLRQRMNGFTHLTPWMAALLAHKAAVLPGRRDALQLAQAFRRLLHSLSAGLFLVDNIGVMDPCEKPSVNVHRALGFSRQEELCCAAQTLLRLLSHGALREILALNPECSVDFESTMNCGGIIVNPSICVFEQTADKATT
eukprot:scpid56039/ scgid18673/ Interleukin enhancer-binding factor 2; Nuclear factor of activated T-cells 45 kDa &gt; Interleukin enhancer-binding factor 2 &gt; Interleukin enhancer-binding factor 2; Nuclear factor of activated T-cells 45 kDa